VTERVYTADEIAVAVRDAIASERRACAQLCHEMMADIRSQYADDDPTDDFYIGISVGCERCRDAIVQRGSI
jgi:hypothetical protein